MGGKNTPRRIIQTGDPDDRRQYVRWSFQGAVFPARIGKKLIEVRLKDMSRGGICAMLDEPVAVGDFIVIEFDEQHKVEAQVRWVRNVMAGMEFGNPLGNRYVLDLHERAEEEREARKAAADDNYLIAPRLSPKTPRPSRSTRADIPLAQAGTRHL